VPGAVVGYSPSSGESLARNTLGSSTAAILCAAIVACAAAAGIAQAQDDWVQVPSSADNPDSKPAPDSSSQSATTASAYRHLGSDDAPVTIVEYSDYQCPYCRQQEAALHQVLTKYDGQVRLIYRDFPMHKNSMEAAMAARCADEQGQFWPYHDALQHGDANLSTKGLETTARDLGLDLESFDSCLEDRKYESAVLADQQMGMKSGVSGTPCLIIGDSRSVPDTRVGSLELNGAQPAAALESAIDDQLRNTH
jgi:protein-disulfide isomerase